MKNNKKQNFNFFILFLLINLLLTINLSAKEAAFKLKAEKIYYKDKNAIIIAEGNAIAIDEYGKTISADKIIYYKSIEKIETVSNSKYEDKKKNIILADNFLYNLALNKLTAKGNVEYYEKSGGEYFFTEFEYYENSEVGYGKNFRGKQFDKSTMESPSVKIDNKNGITILKKISNKSRFKNNNENLYTNCLKESDSLKNIKDRCTDWSFATSETKHDAKTKMVYHKNAFINLRNIPVFYTPYFSHPDPSVQRKSGFLMPSTKNFSNMGRTIKSPYYWAINDESDLTFTPIFYQDENSIFLTEYRLQNKNSSFILDTSYSKGYKDVNKRGDSGENLNRTTGSRNHLFAKFFGSFNNLILRNNDIEINLERISQKNYLNVNQINTSIIKQDIQNLNNNFIINSYGGTQKIKISANIFENLSIDNPNTKYQYKMPSIEYNNSLEKYNQNTSISSTFYATNYDGDTKQINQTNILETESKQKIIKNIGIANVFKTKFSNINLYNDKVSNAKENFNSDFHSSLAVESSLPLGKFLNKTEEILNPKIFMKYAPGQMSNAQDESRILSYADIYSIDRMNSLTNPEKGFSVGYGIDYEMSKKNMQNDIFLKSKFSIGQIITDKKKNEMPTSSSLNEKSSNFVGDFSFFLNRALLKKGKKINNEIKIKEQEFKINEDGTNFKYSFNISNDLDKILKNQIEITHKDEENLFLLNYYELHDIGNSHAIEGKYKRSFENNLNAIFTAKRNLERNYSESNSIEFNYESDCLKIGINLAKTFYESEDIKSDNNLTLFVMLKPFGQPIAPDLTNFISDK